MDGWMDGEDLIICLAIWTFYKRWRPLIRDDLRVSSIAARNKFCLPSLFKAIWEVLGSQHGPQNLIFSGFFWYLRRSRFNSAPILWFTPLLTEKAPGENGGRNERAPKTVARATRREGFISLKEKKVFPFKTRKLRSVPKEKGSFFERKLISLRESRLGHPRLKFCSKNKFFAIFNSQDRQKWVRGMRFTPKGLQNKVL